MTSTLLWLRKLVYNKAVTMQAPKTKKSKKELHKLQASKILHMQISAIKLVVAVVSLLITLSLPLSSSSGVHLFVANAKIKTSDAGVATITNAEEEATSKSLKFLDLSVGECGVCYATSELRPWKAANFFALDDLFASTHSEEILEELFKIKSLARDKTAQRERQQQVDGFKVAQIRHTLSNITTIIRLAIYVDATMRAKLSNNKQRLRNFIRNLVYGAQLIFEQPEMSSKVRLGFRVVSLESASELLEQFLKKPKLDARRIVDEYKLYLNNSQGFPGADLNILLVGKTLWQKSDATSSSSNEKVYRKCNNNDHCNNKNVPKQQQKEARSDLKRILGYSKIGSICRTDRNFVLLSADSLGSATRTLAHEIAHSLNSHHDGYQELWSSKRNIERDCDQDSFIMSPSVGAKKVSWSPCTVNIVANFVASIQDCLNKISRRLEDWPAIETEFEFDTNDGIGRVPLPGINSDAAQQCRDAMSVTAATDSVVDVTKSNSSSLSANERCQRLWCKVGPAIHAQIGPAAPGTACGGSTNGVCIGGSCLNNN